MSEHDVIASHPDFRGYKLCGITELHAEHAWSLAGIDGYWHWCSGNPPAEIGSGRGQWDRPEHYGGEANPFEPIKIIEHYDLNFNLGCVIKYVLRAPFKGTALKDLKKAYTYIGFEIRRRERAGETE